MEVHEFHLSRGLKHIVKCSGEHVRPMMPCKDGRWPPFGGTK